MIELVGSSAENLLGFAFSFSIIVNLLVGNRMNKLLEAVKNLQVIVHLTLMKVFMPANAQIIMTAIFGFLTFDMFDTEALTAGFYSPEDVEVNDSLVQLGYETAYCLINLGSCLYLILGQIFIVILEALLFVCFRLNCWRKRSNKTFLIVEKAKKWFAKQLNGVFWNSILSTLDGA